MFHYNWRDVQIQCAAMGHDPGEIDGLTGPRSRRAYQAALEEVGGATRQNLFNDFGLHSVVWHWTAGKYGLITIERRAYNSVIDQHGEAYDGDFRPEAQATYVVGRAASHTLNANTHRIGVSMDCMHGARERPFEAGPAPMTEAHVDGMLRQTAEWVKDFGIIPSKWTTLSHAEVQPTLNIRQRNKWDITILPGGNKVRDAVKVGDELRERLQDYL